MRLRTGGSSFSLLGQFYPLCHVRRGRFSQYAPHLPACSVTRHPTLNPDRLHLELVASAQNNAPDVRHISQLHGGGDGDHCQGWRCRIDGARATDTPPGQRHTIEPLCDLVEDRRRALGEARTVGWCDAPPLRHYSGIIISRIIFREACNLARPFAGLRMLL